MSSADPQVGPVFQSSPGALPLIEAIKLANADVQVVDRGGYLRVLVPNRCILSREIVERITGRAFRIPGDLEALMPSFKGSLTLSEDAAVWEAK